MQKISAKVPLAAIAIVVIILMVIFAASSTGTSSSKKTYTNKDLGISFSYNSDYSLEEIKSPEKVAIIRLSTQDNANILLVFIEKSMEEVKNDKKFYNSILFNNPNQVTNSVVQMGQFSGFRADIGPDQLRHTVYGTINDTLGLIIRSETSASSTETLHRSEYDFKDIVNSIRFQ